jgi:hypothetical protein
MPRTALLFGGKVKRKKKKGLERNYLTGTQAVAGKVGIEPVDAENAVAPEPVNARHAAAPIARTRTERDVGLVEVMAGLDEVNETVDEALGESLGGNVSLRYLVGREVFQFLVSFLPISDPDGVMTILCSSLFLVPVENSIQVSGVLPALDGVMMVFSDGPIWCKASRDNEEAVEAGEMRRNWNLREIHTQTKVLNIEVLLGSNKRHYVRSGEHVPMLIECDHGF